MDPLTLNTALVFNLVWAFIWLIMEAIKTHHHLTVEAKLDYYVLFRKRSEADPDNFNLYAIAHQMFTESLD